MDAIHKLTFMLELHQLPDRESSVLRSLLPVVAGRTTDEWRLCEDGSADVRVSARHDGKGNFLVFAFRATRKVAPLEVALPLSPRSFIGTLDRASSTLRLPLPGRDPGVLKGLSAG